MKDELNQRHKGQPLVSHKQHKEQQRIIEDIWDNQPDIDRQNEKAIRELKESACNHYDPDHTGFCIECGGEL